MGPFGGHLRAIWGGFVTFGAVLGSFEGHLGWICDIRGHFGVIWEHLSAIWGGFVTFGAVLGVIWGH